MKTPEQIADEIYEQYENERDHLILTPEGYKLDIVAAVEADRRQHTIVTALAATLDDRQHPTAAAWLRENEDDDAVWGMVGNLLDEIERMSEGETR